MKLPSRTIALLASLLLIGVLLFYFSNIVAYTLIAWVLAMLGQPLMVFYQKLQVWKFKIGCTLAALLTLLTFFLVFGLLLAVLLPPIIHQVNNIGSVDYKAIAKALEEPFQNIEAELKRVGLFKSSDSFAAIFEQVFSKWFNPSSIGRLFTKLVSATGTILVGGVSVLFITFFFLRERGLFINFLVALLPKEYEAQTRKAILDSTVLMSRYFRGLFFQMIIFASVVTLLLTVLGVKNALLIGLLAALLNVIPYIGPFIGAIFGLILTISGGLDLGFYTQLLPLLVKVVLVFAAAQMLDNYLVQPYIFSTSVLAHPLEIFLVVLMGAKVSGVMGMILAIPGYTVLRAVARAFLSEFNIVQHLTERMSEYDDEKAGRRHS